MSDAIVSTKQRQPLADLIRRAADECGGSGETIDELADLLRCTDATLTLATLIESPISTKELEDAQRLREVKSELQRDLGTASHGKVSSNTETYFNDLEVKGPLSVIVEWAQDWRSEIEELG